MSRWFVLLLFSVSLARADEGFFLPAELPHRPTHPALERALQASFRLEVGQGMTSECSAQFVSSEGHILTALHCIDTDSALWDALGIQLQKKENAVWVEAGQTTPENISLPRVAFEAPGLGRYDGPAQIVLMGRGFTAGFPEYDPTSGWNADDTTRLSVALNSEDFLLIKVPLRNTPCVQLSDSPLTPGTDVWVIGFPTAATRANGHGSDGVSRYVSYGKVYSSYAETPLLREQNIPAAAIADYDKMLLTPARFLHNADAWIGNSGGMVINRDGEVVGTIARGWETQDSFVDVSTDSVRASRILELAQQRLGDERANQAFSCN